MKITYKTIKNTRQVDKPNEDIVLCDFSKNIYILLDGVSRDNENGQYPNPSPAVEVVKILREEIYRNLMLYNIEKDNILSGILNAIKNANNNVRVYNEKMKLSFAAGAVGMVAIIKENQLYYAYIGDCYGRLIYKDKINIFTECQTELISQHKKEYTSFEIREIICNNIEHPYAYGVLNGDNRAIEFVKLGKIDLSDVEYVILTSDGMEEFLSKCSIGMLKSKDANELLKEAVLYKNEGQDDRTIIKIEKDDFSK